MHTLIMNSPVENRMSKVREICWQTQKAFFMSNIAKDYKYEKEELDSLNNSSSIDEDKGFTCISNRKELPFFTLFCEPEYGFGSVLKYDEKYRRLFAALGNGQVLKAFFYLYSQELDYTFEKEVLAKACDIPEEEIEQIIEQLLGWCIKDGDHEYEINQEKRTLYTVCQRYEMVALFAIANEYLFYANHFSYQAGYRQKPWIDSRKNQ